MRSTSIAGRAKRGRTALIAAVAAAALATTLAACAGSGASSSDGSGSHDELRIGFSAGPTTLDPAKDIAGPQTQLRSLTNQALFHLQPDYTAKPALVDKYGYVGEGNIVFDFTLKKGITFTDGEALNSAAVKGWLEYFASAQGPFAQFLQYKSIETPDDLTVRLNLAVPNPQVPLFLSEFTNAGFVSSPKAVADPKLLASGTYGVGPYVLDEAKSTAGDTYVLEPSKTYFDKNAVHFKSVNVKIISNPQSLLQAFSAGQIDFGNLDPTVANAAMKSGLEVQASKAGSVVVTLLDRDGKVDPALKDVRVRQALNYAVDRDSIFKAVGGGYGKVTSQLQTDAPVASLDDAYTYNPDKARSLLAQAGYANGFTLDVVASGAISGAAADQTLQAVAQNWQAIGVKVNLTQATTDLLPQVVSGKFAAFEWTTAVLPTYVSHALLYAPTAALNPFKVDVPELDDLFAKAATSEPSAATAQWEKYNTVVSEQALNVPLYQYDTPYGMNKNIRGFVAGAPWPSDLTWGS